MGKSLGELRNALNKAEINAQMREKVDLEYINLQEQKAQEKGFKLVKARVRNRARFVQIITDNIDYLNGLNYLTGGEKAFLFEIMPYIQVYTHAIIDPENGEFFSVSGLAKKIGRNRTAVSELIKGLTEKSIMFEFVNVLEIKSHGRSVSRRPFFITPEIICNGDRNRIDAGIAELIIHHSMLEKNGVYLPWRLVRGTNKNYGYLDFRRKANKPPKHNI